MLKPFQNLILAVLGFAYILHILQVPPGHLFMLEYFHYNFLEGKLVM